MAFPGQYLFPGDPSPTCEKAIRNIEGPSADSFNKAMLPAGPRKKVPASGQRWVSEDVSPIFGKTMSSTLEGTADVLSNQLLLRGPRKLATSGAGLGGFRCNSRENGIRERTVFARERYLSPVAAGTQEDCHLRTGVRRNGALFAAKKRLPIFGKPVISVTNQPLLRDPSEMVISGR